MRLWFALPLVVLLASSTEATTTVATPNQEAGAAAPAEAVALAEAVIISNGTLVLGVNPEGHLNATDPTTGEYRGLQYLPTGGDAISPGCQCEGWGIANLTTEVAGWATIDNESPPISENLELVSFISDGGEAESVVRIDGSTLVRHRYRPVVGDPLLYVIELNVTNESAAAANFVYRRVIDWDVPPTEFDEYVTIQGDVPELIRSNNDGFTSPNPLLDPASDPSVDPFVEGLFIDSGVQDHGAMLDIGLGVIDAGQSRTVLLFYGAAPDESAALLSLANVGASVYSLGQPSSEGGFDFGVPNTFIFGYCGAGCFNLGPTALFTISPVDWNGPFQVQFDSSGSSDPEGAFLIYEWDFGDGTTSTLNNPAHAYAAGIYDVTLTVTDSAGQTDVATEHLVITGDPVVDFAPEVRLHPEEDHWPMDPADFIANSVLEWGHASPCEVDYQVTLVDSETLGDGDYRHRAAKVAVSRLGPRCKGHLAGWYYSNQLTRPYDGNDDRAAIDDEEGFYLNFEPAAEPIAFSPFPVWTQARGGSGQVITYWFFYGRSVPRTFDGAELPFPHEGDWENINVILDTIAGIPTMVEFFAHGDPDVAPFGSLSKSEGLHPVVYSARSAHGSYPDAGSSDICEPFPPFCIVDVRADGGAVWQSWLDLRAADDQPWYGFGGAWGEKGTMGNTTGPLGPSVWKLPPIP